jgi:hypothetical protein
MTAQRIFLNALILSSCLFAQACWSLPILLA